MEMVMFFPSFFFLPHPSRSRRKIRNDGFASGECINHGYNKEFLDYCS